MYFSKYIRTFEFVGESHLFSALSSEAVLELLIQHYHLTLHCSTHHTIYYGIGIILLDSAQFSTLVFPLNGQIFGTREVGSYIY